MTPEQAFYFKQQLLAKGLTEEQANEIILSLPSGIDKTSEMWAETIKHLISEGMNNPAIQQVLLNYSEKAEKLEKLEVESQEKFHAFLTNLNMWQKLYSLAFILVGGGVIYFLGSSGIIGKETCQILLTMIITLTVTDAVSTFLKASKNENE
ncbi:hypothetical protein CJD36_010915 [Flavipsychrobacter stenotrophus]|uniref:Uncharacterized protein n=1 Tax=Flavipsychrobacter stenotrophus TaxID=2077091 RepID=A0A2S7SU88_9BACT|nr:hypothetical protein [Flavipsychrobacter stenotrophus]PQJ10479.1 hypothetical protein CJD36_010915 [Flavipsychrobacter stenotrophus]